MQLPKSIKKVKPKPFQRPSISVTTPAEVKREWGWVSPSDLEPGDIIPDSGVVIQVELKKSGRPLEDWILDGSVVYRVDVTVGMPESIVRLYEPSAVVWAFSRHGVA